MDAKRLSTLRAVVRVSSGNFLEMYDFMVFGYYASAIGAAFFPSGNQFLSLMLALMTFGAGFLMRPLGAIVLGAYAAYERLSPGALSRWASPAVLGAICLVLAARTYTRNSDWLDDRSLWSSAANTTAACWLADCQLT